MIEFNFCGLDAYEDLNLIVNEVHDPVGPSITENAQTVPGMVGNIFQGNTYGSKQIDIDVTILADSEEDRAAMLHDLSSLFLQTGSGEYPMIFGNEPDYTYYGHFIAISVPTRLSQTDSNASMTLSFVCSDPKAYGDQVSLQASNNPATITTEGTDAILPILTCIPHQDVTKIAVTDQDGNYAYIGSDVDPDTQTAAVDKEPLVFRDTCQTLAPWAVVTSPTFNVENGVIEGSMTSTANSLKVGKDSNGYADFGAAHAGAWHGPCRQQWLSAACPDYRIRVRFYNNQYYARAMGKLELYLLDSNGKRIGKVMLKDNGNSEEVYAQAQIGDTSNYRDIYYGQGQINQGQVDTKTIKVGKETVTVKVKGKKKTEQVWKTANRTEDLSTDTFTNFYGYIEIQKIGNQYHVEIMKFDDNTNPVWSQPITADFTDTGNQFTGALAGVAFYTAKYDITEDTANPVVHYTNNGMGLCDVSVWNLIDGGNKPQVINNVPVVVAHAGEEIKINGQDHTVYKNGAIFMKYLYIGSTFPKIAGGVPTTLAFEPNLDQADWFLDFRPVRG
ncbi:MAG: distal tail protein Dit [Sporolactobacillus sp.]